MANYMKILKVKVPKGISEENYRAFIISTFLYYACALIHAALLGMFFAIKVYPMAIFNVGSVSIFILNIFFNNKGKTILAFNIAISEILVHACLATLFIGWGSNFPIYALSLLIIIMFTSEDAISIRFLKSGAVTVCIAVLYAYCTLFSPIRILEKGTLTIIGAANLIAVCGTIILSCFIYYKATAKLKADFDFSENLIHEQEKLIKTIMDIIDKLKGTSSDISNNIKTSSVDIKSISDSIQNISYCASANVTVAEQILSNTTQAFNNSLIITDKSISIKMESEKVLEAAAEGECVINESRESILNVESNSIGILNYMQDLKESYLKIEKIIDSITNISSQIKLLALNATIESSKVVNGSSQGFYVIAQQINKLSQETKKSTDGIASIITDLRSKIDNLLLYCEQNLSHVNNGVAKSLAANEKFKYVLHSIENMALSISSIAKASEEQTSRTKYIETSIQYSTESTADIAENVDRINVNTQSQVVLFNELEGVSAKLLLLSEQLNNAVSSDNNIWERTNIYGR